MNRSIKLDVLSKYRTSLMGFAAIMILKFSHFANLYGYIGIVVIGTLLSVVLHKLSGLLIEKTI